jgi:hypothetical protein
MGGVVPAEEAEGALSLAGAVVVRTDDAVARLGVVALATDAVSTAAPGGRSEVLVSVLTTGTAVLTTGTAVLTADTAVSTAVRSAVPGNPTVGLESGGQVSYLMLLSGLAVLYMLIVLLLSVPLVSGNVGLEVTSGEEALASN